MKRVLAILLVLCMLLCGCGVIVATTDIGFFMAVAAQFKVPGGFWWRHSICGRVLKLAWKIVKKVWGYIAKFFRRVGGYIRDAFSMLPVIWQWIAAGGALGFVLIIICATTTAHWYVVSPLVVWCLAFAALVIYCGYSYGVIQKGIQRMKDGDLYEKINTEWLFGSFKIIAEDLNAILEPVVDDGYYMASGYLETLKKHKVREKAKGHGFGYVVVNAPGIEHPIASTVLATGGSGKERNLIYQPKEGVGGKIYPTKKTPLNSEGIRVMTPTEWGRLQGFVGYAFVDENGNDTFSFPAEISRAQQYKQFGNSVTIPVIEEMAHFMLECFDKMNAFQTEMILNLAATKETISRRDVIEHLRVSGNRANYLLRIMKKSSLLTPVVTKGRGANYRLTVKE